MDAHVLALVASKRVGVLDEPDLWLAVGDEHHPLGNPLRIEVRRAFDALLNAVLTTRLGVLRTAGLVADPARDLDVFFVQLRHGERRHGQDEKQRPKGRP